MLIWLKNVCVIWLHQLIIYKYFDQSTYSSISKKKFHFKKINQLIQEQLLVVQWCEAKAIKKNAEVFRNSALLNQSSG